MDKILNNKLKPSIVGLCQALGVVFYTTSVAAFMSFIGNIENEPGYFGIVFMLTLLVFSAGVTGTLVFGLPVYFALKNNISRAISVLGFTFLSLFLILLAAITIFTVF